MLPYYLVDLYRCTCAGCKYWHLGIGVGRYYMVYHLGMN